MQYSITFGIKKLPSLLSLLSNSFFYLLIPMTVMGINPPGRERYTSTYNQLQRAYNDIEEGANMEFDDYNNALLRSLNTILNSSDVASNFAQGKSDLAKNNADKAKLIYDRMHSIYSMIDAFAVRAKSHQTAIDSGQRRGPLPPAEQNILDALNEAENIINQAEDDYQAAQDEYDEAHRAAQEANDRYNEIE